MMSESVRSDAADTARILRSRSAVRRKFNAGYRFAGFRFFFARVLAFFIVLRFNTKFSWGQYPIADLYYKVYVACMNANKRAKSSGKTEAQSRSQRRYTALRVDAQIVERVEKVAVRQRTSPRSVWEQCADIALPKLEQVYGISHGDAEHKGSELAASI